MLQFFILVVLLFEKFVFCYLEEPQQCEATFESCQERTAHYFEDEALVYTVATSQTDGFERYKLSAHKYGVEPTVLGFGKEWLGGDINHYAGGGWKVNLLRQELQAYRNDKERIIIFTDGYDVIFLADLKEIIEKFKKSESRVLFGAEAYCWPDAGLASLYPPVKQWKRFLNSGAYMGYVPEILTLLERESIANDGDDQLFFTKAYLDESLRTQLKFSLDHRSEIFQNLNGASNEVELFQEDKEELVLRNVVTGTQPSVLHGNGPSKLKLNSLGNYLASAWTSSEGCINCKLGHIDLQALSDSEKPTVLVSLFIEGATPFLEEQLEKVAALEYPKNRMHVFIHNAVKYHIPHVKKFVETYGKDYSSLKEIKPEDGTSEWVARDLSLDHCLKKNCDLYFSMDSTAHLDNPHTLRLLAEQNRTIVAPVLVRPENAWSNFWGALTADGFYSRSNDYLDIVHNIKRGLWNVPYINNCYLLNATIFRTHDRSLITYSHDNLDADMAFCANLRDLGVFLYVSNRVDFGHLVNPESYDTTRVSPDMYQIFDNVRDWEERYIHPEYRENFSPDKKPMQPCPDVFWFPIVTEQFCKDLIHMMESFGQWSDGLNSDKRLQGGYEAVPTRDIHMNQVGWEPHWLHFLQRFVRPLQEHIFTGYFHDPPRSLMNFVVRYRPDEQPELRPHHDSSTYTINIALNKRGVDYEGGGCRFLRYNCSVVDTKAGWMLIHPGRLTHYHEGLRVTNGTRYIMIAFVDP